MQRNITIEDVYFSYLSHGIVNKWRLDMMFKEYNGYECFFTHIDTGEKSVMKLPKSSNRKVNTMVEAIFCD